MIESNVSSGLRLTNYDVVSWKVASKGRVVQCNALEGLYTPLLSMSGTCIVYA